MDQSKLLSFNKIPAGKWVDVTQPEYGEQRKRAERLVFLFNGSEPGSDVQQQVLKDLLSNSPALPEVLAPVYFDYGSNTVFEENVFVNHGCYFMDGGLITVKKNTFIGPFCGFYTVNHPLQIEARNTFVERAEPITIGENCWLGANVTILGGVTLEEGCVVAAGSVVTKSFGPDSLIMGNPARCVRHIDQKEKLNHN